VTGLHHGQAVAMAMLPSFRYNFSHCFTKLARIEQFLAQDPGLTSETFLADRFIARLERWVCKVRAEVARMELSNEDIAFIADTALKSSNISSNPASINGKQMLQLVTQVVR
jgi:alcohol dehydrogenase class IV